MTLLSLVGAPPPSDPLYTKTVYGLLFPETRSTLEELWRPASLALYEDAYELCQDGAHERLLESYRKWVAPVALGLEAFPNGAITAGSTEAIRESIVMAATEHPRPTIHVFDGEYEGYQALAEGYGLTVTRHPREHYQETLLGAQPNDIFYLSAPSAIDGNQWPGYSDFLALASALVLRVRVDLCYVGATRNLAPVKLDFPCVDTVFWSLSKVFGVYYHRIGGVLSRTPYPGLYGQRWFKNMASIELGLRLLAQSTPSTFPTRYAWAQEAAIEHLAEHDIPATPSQALMLATAPAYVAPMLTRSPSFDYARLCLTSTMDKILRHTSR